MSGAQSISTRRVYGVQRVCRVWHRARSSVYARRQATRTTHPRMGGQPFGPEEAAYTTARLTGAPVRLDLDPGGDASATYGRLVRHGYSE